MDEDEQNSTGKKDLSADKSKTASKSSSVSSQNSTNEPQQEAAAENEASNENIADPICTICFNEAQNRSFTYSCHHIFCFNCLKKWAKVKPRCPLCKKEFKSIVHNVRSTQDYDEYHINPGSDEEEITWHYYGYLYEKRASGIVRLSKRNSNVDSSLRLQISLRAAYSVPSLYRQRIYAQSLWVNPLPCENSATPQLFQQNPELLFRIHTWLYRELLAVLRTERSHIAYVFRVILDLIIRFNIRSREFFHHVESYFAQYTNHFIHEFYNFSISILSVEDYDCAATYAYRYDPALKDTEPLPNSDILLSYQDLRPPLDSVGTEGSCVIPPRIKEQPITTQNSSGEVAPQFPTINKQRSFVRTSPFIQRNSDNNILPASTPRERSTTGNNSQAVSPPLIILGQYRRKRRSRQLSKQSNLLSNASNANSDNNYLPAAPQRQTSNTVNNSQAVTPLPETSTTGNNSQAVSSSPETSSTGNKEPDVIILSSDDDDLPVSKPSKEATSVGLESDSSDIESIYEAPITKETNIETGKKQLSTDSLKANVQTEEDQCVRDFTGPFTSDDHNTSASSSHSTSNFLISRIDSPVPSTSDNHNNLHDTSASPSHSTSNFLFSRIDSPVPSTSDNHNNLHDTSASPSQPSHSTSNLLFTRIDSAVPSPPGASSTGNDSQAVTPPPGTSSTGNNSQAVSPPLIILGQYRGKRCSQQLRKQNSLLSSASNASSDNNSLPITPQRKTSSTGNKEPDVIVLSSDDDDLPVSKPSKEATSVGLENDSGDIECIYEAPITKETSIETGKKQLSTDSLKVNIQTEEDQCVRDFTGPFTSDDHDTSASPSHSTSNFPISRINSPVPSTSDDHNNLNDTSASPSDSTSNLLFTPIDPAVPSTSEDHKTDSHHISPSPAFTTSPNPPFSPISSPIPSTSQGYKRKYNYDMSISSCKPWSPENEDDCFHVTHSPYFETKRENPSRFYSSSTESYSDSENEPEKSSEKKCPKLSSLIYHHPFNPERNRSRRRNSEPVFSCKRNKVKKKKHSHKHKEPICSDSD